MKLPDFIILSDTCPMFGGGGDFLKINKLYEYLLRYKQWQQEKITSLVAKDVFLSDYYGVLANIYLVLTNPKKFYDDHDVAHLSEQVAKKVLGGRDYNIENFDDFMELVNRSRGAYSKHIPVIDEAQDFHPLERDILFEIFHKKNMVVATGGQEQLIRHQLECDWLVDNQGKKHNVVVINKRNKSYRLKEKIADLCNFLARQFEIKLDLEVDKIQDKGKVWIDFGSCQNWRGVFTKLAENGERNSLMPCESVYIMLEAASARFERGQSREGCQVSENNIVLDVEVRDKKSFDVNKMLQISSDDYRDFYCYHMEGNGKNDEQEQEMIGSEQYLVSFYESCRGLESWSVMCLELDEFYKRKKEEEVAMNFLSDDLLITPEQRRQRYAMTWVLMALTRAMDGLYIHIRDKDSELGKILMAYRDVDC